MYNVVLPFSCTDCDFANIMTIETQDCESDSLNLLLLLSALPIYANSSCITISSHTSHTHGEYNFCNIKESKEEPYKCKICESYALENLCSLHTLNLYLTNTVKYLQLLREPKCDLFCIALLKPGIVVFRKLQNDAFVRLQNVASCSNISIQWLHQNLIEPHSSSKN